MSPFNADKFRLDSTSQGGVNGSIDRKIEKLSKKCADLIQRNKHKDAKKILEEIKELKSLRLPEEETNTQYQDIIPELEKTLISTPVLQIPDAVNNLEKTVITTPAFSDQEKTVVTTPSITESDIEPEKKEPQLKHFCPLLNKSGPDARNDHCFWDPVWLLWQNSLPPDQNLILFPDVHP